MTDPVIISNHDGSAPEIPRRLHECWMTQIERMPHRAIGAAARLDGSVSIELMFSFDPFEPGQIVRSSIGASFSAEQTRWLAAHLLPEAEMADRRGAIVTVEVLPAPSARRA